MDLDLINAIDDYIDQGYSYDAAYCLATADTATTTTTDDDE